MMDYTVIAASRHRFGDENAEFLEPELERNAPFVGVDHTFLFDCTDIDRNEIAILQLMTLGISHRNNIIQVNSENIPGGLGTSVESDRFDVLSLVRQIWVPQTLLVRGPLLRPVSNRLFVRSVASDGDPTNEDNFVLDNIVLFYKTRKPQNADGPVINISLSAG